MKMSNESGDDGDDDDDDDDDGVERGFPLMNKRSKRKEERRFARK